MERFMAQLVVRNLDEDIKAKLQQRARRHGRSMEEEVRDILREAVKGEGGDLQPLGTRLKARFAGIGLDQDIPELHGQPARPADFAS
jgi:plasmid stability protein